MARFKERFDELAMALCGEAGKPINDSEGEVTRLIVNTFSAAEGVDSAHARRTAGVEYLAESERGIRVCGSACRLDPVRLFRRLTSFPLNLAAHKIAPALAVVHLRCDETGVSDASWCDHHG